MEVCDSHELSQYGLKNVVLPAGTETFVEILQPTGLDSPGARFLRGRGQGMYLITFEADELDDFRAHLEGQGIQVTEEVQWNGYRSIFIHPTSLNGVLMEFSEPGGGPNPWSPAGDAWHTKTWEPITRQIRQVAVLVHDLDTAIASWESAFKAKFTLRFPVAFTELEIAVMPLADDRTFIELAQPTNPDSSAARHLQRHGEGLYLLIFEVADVAKAEEHLRSQDLHITTARDAFSKVSQSLPTEGIRSVWIHPRSMKGVFTQLSEVVGSDNPWPPAGDEWNRARQERV